jgi:glycosyltransferase involved in cell wall biosynthesis
VYGRYKFLDEAIKSVASQTRQPDNVIVFTDNGELIRKVLERHRVKAEVYQEPHLSLPATYARIGEVVGTEYILPLEDDDVFKPNKLEVMEKYCNGYPLIKHAADFVDEESRPINVPEPQPADPLVISREKAWRHFLSYSYHAFPSTFAIKTTLLKKYKKDLFELKLHADFAIFVLALLEGDVLYVPERLTYYRVGSGHSQLTTCEKLPKVVCTWNKYAHDDFTLWKTISDKHIKKLVLKTYLQHMLMVYILNNNYECPFKYKVGYFHILSSITRYIMEYFPHIHLSPIKVAGLALLSPFLGKKKSRPIYLKTEYAKDLQDRDDYSGNYSCSWLRLVWITNVY